MPAMTKRVNIRANVAVRNVNPPIHGTCNDIIMTTGDILKCLCKRAHVEEILPNGTTVTLNMKNYFTDNGAGLFVKKGKPIIEKNSEPKKDDKTSEIPKTPVVESVDEKKEDKPDESVTPPAEPETNHDESNSEVDETKNEDKPNEEATAVSEETKEDDIPVATSGYVQVISEDDDNETVEEFTTKTAVSSTESKSTHTKKYNNAYKSGSKHSSSKKK